VEVSLNAHVECSDGRVGRVDDIILNPANQRVTHLVVWKTDIPSTDTRKLVPETLITRSSHDTTYLSITKEHFDQLEDFIQSEFFPSFEVQRMAESSHFDASVTPVSVIVPHEAIPPEAIVVRKGARVVATDGHVGHVDDFLVEKTTGRITHLILRRGHLWGKKDTSVPAGQIDRYDDESVHLKIDKRSVECLPDINVGSQEE
jgi:sporulation protein YlmC with PRC-barrel domain